MWHHLDTPFQCDHLYHSAHENKWRRSGEVYPNPTTGWLHITNSSSDAGNYQVRLFDLNGKMVMEMETGWLEAGIPASVDISHLSAGTYTWQTSCQGKTRQGLITKNKDLHKKKGSFGLFCSVPRVGVEPHSLAATRP